VWDGIREKGAGNERQISLRGENVELYKHDIIARFRNLQQAKSEFVCINGSDIWPITGYKGQGTQFQVSPLSNIQGPPSTDSNT